MLIQINSIAFDEVKNAKGGYKTAVVQYLKDGKNEEKKIMSFANPGVFAALQGMANFPVQVDVKNVKNAKGYWEWSAIGAPGAAPVGAAAPEAPRKVSNFESSEERAARQVMIVRQSSLSNAIALMTLQGDKKVGEEQVIALAKKFESYVLGNRVEQIEDDIPF